MYMCVYMCICVYMYIYIYIYIKPQLRLKNGHCTADVPVFSWCSDLPTKHCLHVYAIEYIPLYFLF